MDTFESVTSGVKNVATIIAIIVGGIWTKSVFNTTQQKALAEKDLAARQADLVLKQSENERVHFETEEMRRQRDRINLISADIQVRQLTSSLDKVRRAYAIEVELTLTNTGRNDVDVDLENATFLLCRVEAVASDGTPTYADTQRLKFQFPDYIVTSGLIRAGTPLRLYAVQFVRRAGTYVARFRAPAEGGKYRDAERFFEVNETVKRSRT